MHTLIIYAHPWEGSYNAAIRKSVENGLKQAGNTYEVIDLNKENFNPVLTENELKQYSQGSFLDPKVGEYQEMVKKSDSLVFIFPIWWGSCPAIVQGFFDKVLLPGFAYSITKMHTMHGHLKGKTAVVITTMNAPRFYYNFILKAPVRNHIIRNTLRVCGISKSKWIELADVLSTTQKKREQWLKNIEQYFASTGEKAIRTGSKMKLKLKFT